MILTVVMWLGVTGPGLARAAVVIDDIEFNGVTIFDANRIETVLEIFPGEPLIREKVVRTSESLRALYQKNGYRRAQVQSGLVTRKRKRGTPLQVLVFNVKEGKPSRVDSVAVFYAGSAKAPEKAQFERLRDELTSRVVLKPGDIVGEEKINDLRRELESYLATQEFYEARIQVRETFKDGPTSSEWMDLEFSVDLGERVTFGFRGNERMTKSELMKIVEDQRVLGLTRDYVQVIRDKILQAYIDQGYTNVGVEAFTFDRNERRERHVTYRIDEGPRVRISGIQFDGNTVFSDDELLDEFMKLAPTRIQNDIYVKGDIEKTASLVMEIIRSKGYLSSKLISVNTVFDEKRRNVNVVIYLYEGEQTVVRSIEIIGNHHLPDSRIKEILSIYEDDPLNLYTLTEGLERLKFEYRELGYLDAKVLNEDSQQFIQYSQKNLVADIHIEIDEGPLFRVSTIELAGLEKTEEHVVRRELEFQEEGILDGLKLSRTESKLKRLGIFTKVQLLYRDDPNRPGYKEVRVSLTEAVPGYVAGGLGIRNDFGLRGFGEFGYINLMGKQHSWAITAETNRRFDNLRFDNFIQLAEYRLRTSYTWPWFLGASHLTVRPQLVQERIRYVQFKAETFAFQLTLERPVFQNTNFIAALTYSLERTRQFDAPDDVDNQTLRIGALIPSLTLDLRNDPLAPSSGFFSTASFEYATTGLGSQSDPFPVSYTRAQFRADQFIPLGRGFVWFLSFRTGVEQNLISPDSVSDAYRLNVGVPLIKQFALGGARSLRGFNLQELNVQDQIIQGTASYVNYRTQLDFPISGALKIGPFLDAANLLIDAYSFGNLRYGAGLGIHYQTPIGPVNFDWGFKLDPRPGEEPSVFYFTVGIL